jgi:hypothetical protein
VPAVWLAKFSEAGVSEMMGVNPVPLSETTCGLPAALSAMVKEPVRLPAAVGAKVTDTVQEVAAAKLAAQSEL